MLHNYLNGLSQRFRIGMKLIVCCDIVKKVQERYKVQARPAESHSDGSAAPMKLNRIGKAGVIKREIKPIVN